MGVEPQGAYNAKELRELKASAERTEDAPLPIKKVHRRGTEPNALKGLFEANIGGDSAVVEYEPDT